MKLLKKKIEVAISENWKRGRTNNNPAIYHWIFLQLRLASRKQSEKGKTLKFGYLVK